MNQEMMNVNDIANVLNISRPYVYTLIKTKILPEPTVKRGRTSLWEKKTIDDFSSKWSRKNPLKEPVKYEYEFISKNLPHSLVTKIETAIRNILSQADNICPKCGLEFYRRRRDQVYCSERCRSANGALKWRRKHLGEGK